MLKEKADLIPHGLDEKVFTPKYLPAEIFPLDDPRKAEITLGQLLSMSAGIRGINPVYVHGKRKPGIRRLTTMVLTPQPIRMPFINRSGALRESVIPTPRVRPILRPSSFAA